MNRRLLGECLAELAGTFFIVLFGCGSVCSTRTGAWTSVWQVASCWGFGVALAIYATADISGAHLNPAITLAFRLVRPEGLTWSKANLYMIFQLLGGILGGFINLAIYNPTLVAFERQKGITRGDPESILSAMAFGEYYPNPDLSSEWTEGGVYKESDVHMMHALFVEAWGTAVLAFMVFSFTHKENGVFGDQRAFLPFMIGCTVAVNLGLYAPITQAGWNPARDFGPRIAAAICGWGKVAIPGNRNGFWIYIFGPFIGGPAGAFLAETLWNTKTVKENGQNGEATK